MNRYLVMMATVMLAGSAALTAAPAGARALAVTSSGGGTWGQAKQVPGLATLSKGGSAAILAVSCASAGNCSAGGHYAVRGRRLQAFVVSQVNGTWHSAKEVPGTATLNRYGAQITSVSCASAGNCSAGGHYTDSSKRQQAFVVSQVNGTWGTAEEVPGTAVLNEGGKAQVNSVSCGAPGNCSAGGRYMDNSGNVQAFVVSDVNGTWGTAEEVPGNSTLNTGGDAVVISVSCGSAGNCSAGGFYSVNTPAPASEPFVVSQVNGTWGHAEQVAGALNRGYEAQTSSVSCASAGNCSAGGYYSDSSGQQAFVVSQVNGTWGTAEEVPGTAALNQGGLAYVTSVSCASAGSCSAGGGYQTNYGQAFVVSQVNGTWGTAEEVPGLAMFNQGPAKTTSVSCGLAGNCSAGGFYSSSSSQQAAFVVSQVNGTWGTAEQVPGTTSSYQYARAQTNSVSCASASHCSAGGYYADSSGNGLAFVVSRT